MTIIKEGDPYRCKALMRFECDICGCIFDANKDEYKTDTQYNDIFYYCKCPCCGRQANPPKNKEGLCNR